MNNHEFNSSDSPSPTSVKRARKSNAFSLNQSLEQQQPPSFTIRDTDDEQIETIFGWEYDNIDPIVQVPPSEHVTHINILTASGTKKAGETWYMVSVEWISKWTSYCSGMAEQHGQSTHLFPGPVDNNSLIENEHHLLPNLIEKKDYVCVPEEGWLYLERWYGISKTPIQRQVVKGDPRFRKDIIEIYPLTIKVLLASKNCDLAHVTNENLVIDILRETSLQDVKLILLDAVGLDQATGLDLRSIDEYFLESTLATSFHFSPFILNLVLHGAEKIDMDSNRPTIGKLGASGDTLVMILSNETDSPAHTRTSSINSATSSTLSKPCNFGFDFKKNTRVSESPPPDYSDITRSPIFSQQYGICGLFNLGNTCFMNSALQCLSNTAQLSQWFLDGKYKEDLNRSNPLGMNGEIAESYGRLIKELWNGNITNVDPGDFKRTICQFSSLFTESQQHDSQELLAFLLDGLHEDTNRILEKPYKEMTGFDGMTDEQMSKMSWEYHKARNDSIIVDLFHGQFKSQLACNTCQQVSVTFDPFMYLSLPLPLPVQKNLKIEILFVPYDPSTAHQCMTITLDKNASIEQLKIAVADQAIVIDPSSLYVLEIYDNAIYKVFLDHEPFAALELNDLIYVYELPVSLSLIMLSSNPETRNQLDIPSILVSGYNCTSEYDNDDFDGEHWIVFPVYCSTPSKLGRDYDNEQIGRPILLAIQAKDATCPDNLYRLIAKHVERYTILKLFEQVHDPSQESIPKCPPTTTTSPPAVKSSNTLEQQYHSDYTQPASNDATRMDPISNLFSMKIFTEYRYANNQESIEPTNSGKCYSVDLEDVRDRFIRNINGEHDKPVAHDTTHDSRILSRAPMKSQSKIRQPSPPLSPTQQPAVIIASHPRTVIRQGEGILLEWERKTAQEFFGVEYTTPSPHPYDNYYCEIDRDRWMDVEIVPDPAVDTDDPEQSTTLMHCLDEFTKRENLSQDDLWYCPQCKKYQRATKKFDLWQLPEIMVIHLKRFIQTESSHGKIDTLVEFPIDTLDMTDRVLGFNNVNCLASEDRLIYDLYAVDNHIGSMGVGHYTSFAQNWYDDLWYFFGDTHVHPINKQDAMTSAAYLLFYKRRRLASPIMNKIF